MKPVRGGGSASELTITSWSALATTTRSSRPSTVVSSSSAVRRSTEVRSSIRTIRASAPASPEVSPTRPTRSPTTTPRAAQLAGPHRGHRVAAVRRRRCSGPGRRRPRSRRRPASWRGRVRVRGRDDRPGRTRTSSSSYSALALQAVPPSRQLLPVTIADHSAGNSGMVFEVHATSVELDARHGQPDHRGGVRHPVVGVGLERRRRAAAAAGSPARPPTRRSRRRAGRARGPARRAGRSRGRGCAPTPRSRDGESASAASAASTGVSSLTSDRSASRPCIVPVPRTVSPAVVEGHLAAHRGAAGRAAGRPAGWCCAASPGTVTSPPVTSAAARNGAAPDRSGSISQPRPASRPGSTVHTSGTVSSTVGPGGAQHLHGHPQVRRAGHRRADVADHHARGRSAGAASSSPETSWLEAEASMVTSPPRDPAGAVHGQRQAAAVAPPSIRTPRSAQRPQQRAERAAAGLRVAVEGRPCPSASAGDRRQEPHHGAGQADVDVGRAAQRRAAGPPSGRRPQWRCAVPRARSPAAISSVSRARSGSRSVVGPTGQRGEHQGPRGHRLGAGQAHRRRDRARGGRRGPRRRRPGRGRVRHGPFCRSAGRGAGRRARPGRRDSRRGRRRVACGRHVRAVRVDPERGRPGRAVRGRATRPTARWCPTTTSRRPIRCRSSGCPPGARPTGAHASARWGLVPAWSRDAVRRRPHDQRAGRDGGRLAARSPVRSPQRRCLVPADGWYEWRRRLGGTASSRTS